MSPGPITHNDYLLLDDGILFCAFGDLHRPGSVVGMPYYAPASLVGGMGFAAEASFEYDGVAYVKLENPAANPAYRALVENGTGAYAWLNPGKTALVWADRSHVVRTHSPKAAIKAYLRRALPPDPVVQLIGFAREFDRGLPERMGLGGSTNILGRRASASSDIDVVVYGRHYPRVVQALCRELVEKRGYEYLSGAGYAEYDRKRVHRYGGLGHARERLLRSRWDTVVSPEGFTIDFSFARPDGGPRWFEWRDLKKTVTLNARVVDDSDSFFAPCTLVVGDDVVKTVCITSRGYCCIFRRGDVLLATGRLYECERGQKALMVDETAGDAISAGR